MKRSLLLLLLPMLALAAPASSVACFNDYVPNVGAIEHSRSVLARLRKHELKEPWETRRDRLRAELAAGGDYRVKNDLATSLAHTGEAAEAVTLLEQVEAEKPGLYATASNLGTAYELAGNDEKALFWIRKGIERNWRAHEETEWLHVRILEAKLALKEDPKWLEFRSVLGPRTIPYLDDIEITAVGNRGEKLSTRQVKTALMYQLHERLQFVQPPDAIVGALLLDLGNLVRQEPFGDGGAYDIFLLSNTYLHGVPNVDPLETMVFHHLMYGKRGQRLPPPLPKTVTVPLWCLGGLGLGMLIIYCLRSAERRQARKDRTAQPNVPAVV